MFLLFRPRLNLNGATLPTVSLAPWRRRLRRSWQKHPTVGESSFKRIPEEVYSMESVPSFTRLTLARTPSNGFWSSARVELWQTQLRHTETRKTRLTASRSLKSCHGWRWITQHWRRKVSLLSVPFISTNTWYDAKTILRQLILSKLEHFSMSKITYDSCKML